MRGYLSLAATSAALSLSLFGTPAHATLHGWCGTGPANCQDNGTNSPVTQNPPPAFGFTSSPGGEQGTLSIVVLVPDNEAAGIASFTISGVTASKVKNAPWTTGQLDTYLGINASPENSIGAFLPTAQSHDSGAMGFIAFEANMGFQTLSGSGASTPHFTIGDLPMASYLVGFLDQKYKVRDNQHGEGEDDDEKASIDATANSGAIFVTSGSPTYVFTSTDFVPAPEPATLTLFGVGLAGLGFLRRRTARSRG